MPSMQQAAEEFLARDRIAVAGVSREGGGKHGGNVVYKRLKERGYDVFAVNPKADTVEGDPCYHDLKSIPGGVDAVVIATNPKDSLSVAEECEALGIERVWMHRNIGQGSYSAEAHDFCRQHGILAIDGGCPLMYGRASDGGHRFMRVCLSLFGQVPREV